MITARESGGTTEGNHGGVTAGVIMVERLRGNHGATEAENRLSR